MPKFEIFEVDPEKLKRTTIVQTFEKGRAIERAQELGAVDVTINTSKAGICNVSLIVDNKGRSLHLVNAVAASRIPLQDAAKTTEYPDIIITDKQFNLETILQKLSEYLSVKFQLREIKVNAYRNSRSFKDKKPAAIFDPLLGTIQITA